MTAILPKPRATRPAIPSSESLQERADPLRDLLEAGLNWLAEYAPAAFDSAIEIARTWDETPTPALEMAPYCAVCSAPVGIFTADGDDWRHYRDKFERYDAGHTPVIGWRPAR
jgi:hypothetical protein